MNFRALDIKIVLVAGHHRSRYYILCCTAISRPAENVASISWTAYEVCTHKPSFCGAARLKQKWVDSKALRLLQTELGNVEALTYPRLHRASHDWTRLALSSYAAIDALSFPILCATWPPDLPRAHRRSDGH